MESEEDVKMEKGTCIRQAETTDRKVVQGLEERRFNQRGSGAYTKPTSLKQDTYEPAKIKEINFFEIIYKIIRKYNPIIQDSTRRWFSQVNNLKTCLK